jgi:antitoxin (DNA-binding transcriptional repressor) of toxin-antitoxin stability system
MYQVEIGRVQEQLEEIIESALEGKEVVITQEDKPVLKLVRISHSKVRRQPGSAKGLIQMSDDFDDLLSDFADYMP